MDARARRFAALGAITAVAAAGLGAGVAPAMAATAQEEREACKAKIAVHRAAFSAINVIYKERWRARQEARRAAYVAEGPHTQEENRRFIRRDDRLKMMFHELMERRRRLFNERMRAIDAACESIGHASGTASATALLAAPEEPEPLSAAEEARIESEPLLAR
jgi:hypothetical protein